MSEQNSQDRAPIETWLPPLLLKFAVMVVFACVIGGAMVGVLQHELDSNRLWLIIGGMVALLLLLGVDRLTALRVGPTGVEAELAQAKKTALAQAEALEDKEVAEAAQAQILQAQTPAEVQGAIGMALELNVSRVVDRVKAAIRDKRKLYVRYRSAPEAETDIWLVAPLDIKPGKTAKTRTKDYLWVHSYDSGGTRSLLLERVVGADLSDETFDPAEIMADLKNQSPEWNVERDW